MLADVSAFVLCFLRFCSSSSCSSGQLIRQVLSMVSQSSERDKGVPRGPRPSRAVERCILEGLTAERLSAQDHILSQLTAPCPPLQSWRLRCCQPFPCNCWQNARASRRHQGAWSRQTRGCVLPFLSAVQPGTLTNVHLLPSAGNHLSHLLSLPSCWKETPPPPAFS